MTEVSGLIHSTRQLDGNTVPLCAMRQVAPSARATFSVTVSNKCYTFYIYLSIRLTNPIDVFVGWNQTCQKILHVQTSLFRAKIDF